MVFSECGDPEVEMEPREECCLMEMEVRVAGWRVNVSCFVLFCKGNAGHV